MNSLQRSKLRSENVPRLYLETHRESAVLLNDLSILLKINP